MCIVEHKSYNTFIKMHTSPTQAAAMEKVKGLLWYAYNEVFTGALPGMYPPNPAGRAMHSIGWGTQSDI